MFKTTAQYQLESGELAAAARRFKTEVQQGLEGLLSGELRDSERLPDLTFLHELIGRLLDRNSNQLAEVDGRQSNQLRNAAVLRAERDQLSEALRARMRDVRYLLDRNVQEGAVKATLRDRRLSVVRPRLLVSGARDLIAALRDPKLSLERLSEDRTVPSAEALAQALESEIAQLEQVLLLLSPQKKESEAELGSKRAEVEKVTEKNRRCADALFGLFRLAGIDFHAERLRPKARSKKRVEERKEELPAGGAPAPMTALMRVS